MISLSQVLDCETLSYIGTDNTTLGHLPRDVLAKIAPGLRDFGSDAISNETNILIGNAESQEPYIKAHNVWGARYEVDRLVTSTGWKELGKWGIKHG
jgi:hypothetical protein